MNRKEEMDREIILSVIIPIYNGEKYLHRMMEMLDSQTFQHFEVLFIDDGSEDDTYRICREYEKKRSHIRVIRQKNQGVSCARNTGIEEAMGQWIQFIDVDDLIRPDMFECFYKGIKMQESEADLAICGCIRRISGTDTSVFCGPEKSRYLNKKAIAGFLKEMKMESRYWLLDYVWNKWYQKDILERFHIRFLKTLSLGEDFVFNTQYFQYINSLVFIPKYCYEYEVHPDGLVSRFQKQPWVGRHVQYDYHKELYYMLDLWEKSCHEVRCQYGQIFWGDIRRINSPGCGLKRKERLEFIEKAMADEMFDMMIEYLSQKKGIPYIIYKNILKTRNIRLIYSTIRIEKLIAYLCN